MDTCVRCNIDRCEIWEVVCMFCMEELDEMAYFEIEYDTDDSNENEKYDTEIYNIFYPSTIETRSRSFTL